MRAQRGANAGLDSGGRGRVGIPPLLLGGRPGNGQRAGSLRPVHGEVRRADDRAHAAQEQTGTTRLRVFLYGRSKDVAWRFVMVSWN